MSALLAFALSPIGRLLCTAVMMFSLGTAAGWRGEKAFSDSRWFKAQTAALTAKTRTLEARIKVANAATVEDQKRAADAEAARNEFKKRAEDAEARLKDAPAFDADDTGRLLDLWRHPGRRPAKR